MPEYHVYHSNNTRDSMCYANDAEAGYPFDMGWVVGKMLDGSYAFVAEMDTDCLGLVYEFSQNGHPNLHSPWIRHISVKGIGPGFEQGARSTSVGDVIHDTLNNKFYIVASFGFDEIDFAKLLGNK